MKHVNYSCRPEITGGNKPLAPPNAFSRKGHYKGLRAEVLEKNPQKVATIARSEGGQAQALGGAPGMLPLSKRPYIAHRPANLYPPLPGAHPRHTGRPGQEGHVREPVAQSPHAARSVGQRGGPRSHSPWLTARPVAGRRPS